MSTVAFILGISFLLLGVSLYFFPTKKPNLFYGYRTARAIRDIKSWKIAQRYSSKWLLFNGICSMAIGISTIFIDYSERVLNNILIGCTLVILVLTIVFTERKLKNAPQQ